MCDCLLELACKIPCEFHFQHEEWNLKMALPVYFYKFKKFVQPM